ncbi:MAG TPA: hypothetical protein VFH47_06130 [Candidatus Thermoplasmatota archaeon]|nr:hypothetical protein [Candidatus Thermoplasmatota archaeon]
MRGLLRASLLALAACAALASAGPAAAAINGPMPVELAYGFDEGLLTGAAHTIVSGSLEAALSGGSGASHGFLNVSGARIDGITGACWEGASPGCLESPDGTLALVVPEGATFGMRLPAGAPVALQAEAAMAVFADLTGSAALGALGVGRSLVVVAEAGEARFGPVQPIPLTLQRDAAAQAMAGEDGSSLELRQDGRRIASVQGQKEVIWFTGALRVAPFTFEAAVVPFGDGDAVGFREPAEGASRAFDLARLADVVGRIQGAAAQPQDGGVASGLEAVMADVLATSVLRLPAAPEDTREEFALVRYTHLVVEGRGESLSWSGTAALAVQGAAVQGARPLVGSGMLQVPWWSLLLWAAALGVAVGNVALRRPKKDAASPAMRPWGWLLSAAAAATALVLWDLETRAVWGVSATSPGLGARARLLMLLVEAAPLALLGAAAFLPLRMLLRGVPRLLGRPSLGHVVAPAAYLVAFLLAATYLRAYVQVFVGQVLQRVAA